MLGIDMILSQPRSGLSRSDLRLPTASWGRIDRLHLGRRRGDLVLLRLL
jgi:hypothetical protein